MNCLVIVVFKETNTIWNHHTHFSKILSQNLPFGLYFEVEGSDSTLTLTWEVRGVGGGRGGEGKMKHLNKKEKIKFPIVQLIILTILLVSMKYLITYTKLFLILFQQC